MSMRKIGYVWVVMVFVASLAFAQSYGTLGGSIQDVSGAVIPGAVVTLTNTATGVVTRVTSLADGQYLVTNLAPGTYEAAVEAQGFKRYASSGVEVHVSDRITLNVALQVGETRETITVTGETPVLRT